MSQEIVELRIAIDKRFDAQEKLLADHNDCLQEVKVALLGDLASNEPGLKARVATLESKDKARRSADARWQKQLATLWVGMLVAVAAGLWNWWLRMMEGKH